MDDEYRTPPPPLPPPLTPVALAVRLYLFELRYAREKNR